MQSSLAQTGFQVFTGTPPSSCPESSTSNPPSLESSPMLSHIPGQCLPRSRSSSSGDLSRVGSGIASTALQSSLKMMQNRSNRSSARRRSINITPLTLSPMSGSEVLDSDDDCSPKYSPKCSPPAVGPSTIFLSESPGVSQLSPYPSPSKPGAVRRLSLGLPGSPRSPLCQALPNIPNNLIDFLDSMPWLEDAPIEFKAKIAMMAEVRHVHSGGLIIRKGEMARAVLFVARGIVEIISEDGEIVYAEIGEGTIFGEIGILYNVARTCSCRAATSVLEEAEKRIRELQELNHATKQEVLGKEFAVSSIAESLLAVPLFGHLDRGFIYQISMFTRVHLFQSGETIMDTSRGQPCQDLFMLIRGHATIKEYDSRGAKLVVTSIYAGSFFGEVSVFFNEKPGDNLVLRTISAKTACDTLVLSRESMEAFLRRNPEAAESIREVVIEKMLKTTTDQPMDVNTSPSKMHC